jgi:hypothetical protein
MKTRSEIILFRLFIISGGSMRKKMTRVLVILCVFLGGFLFVNCTKNFDSQSFEKLNIFAKVQTTADITLATTRLSNISTRGTVLTGEDVLIAGFVISGSSSKTVVVRGDGPSLAASGVANVLANPQLRLFKMDLNSGTSAEIASNDDWVNTENRAQLESTPYVPKDTKEAAIIKNLEPGAYTAILSGAGNTTGVGLVAVFEVDHPENKLINISTRGKVLNNEGVMIAGFIISGTAPKTVVVRGDGPSLSNSGIANPLPNPQLRLFRMDTATGTPTEIAFNDDWQSADNSAALRATNYQPTDPKESAIMITLNPGAYTAILSGDGVSTGVGLIAVHDLNAIFGENIPGGLPATPAYSGSFANSGNFKDICLGVGQFATVKLPLTTATNRHAEIIPFQSTLTPSTLNAQVVISTIPGDFKGTALCEQHGNAWSGMDLYAFTNVTSQYCYAIPGKQYYVNYRHVEADLTTPSCKQESCCARLQYIGDFEKQ